MLVLMKGPGYAAMTNQQLIDSGRNQMDQTDEAIARSKMVAF